MFTTIVKALVVIWPFFKAVILKDRSAMEVLDDNRHLTGMFVVIIVVALMFYVTLTELSETKTVLKAREQEISQLRRSCIEPKTPGVTPLDDDTTVLETQYDKNPLLEMLEIRHSD